MVMGREKRAAINDDTVRMATRMTTNNMMVVSGPIFLLHSSNNISFFLLPDELQYIAEQ
eukprot:CAMPEP_0194737958 /NCGR_PEP_ID=MMETSP0296-20130528/83185_1 /TAXON_ID=39354 /ORGANISM="Heterosigma akashiwo, Strain CCMP2393" /LENGTH=58 /DNA_ID=CAMNT_0039648099 /DNA_START=70 /DNA_END=246 /DNA_ORIENTATION=-